MSTCHSLRVCLHVAWLADPTATRTLGAVGDDLGHVDLVVRIGVLLDAQHTEATHTFPVQLDECVAVRLLMHNVLWIDIRQIDVADRLCLFRARIDCSWLSNGLSLDNGHWTTSRRFAW